MKRTIKILLLVSGLMVLQLRCVEKYNSPYVSPRVGYLVVEGYISGNSPTEFTLTRTIPLPGDTAVPPGDGCKGTGRGYRQFGLSPDGTKRRGL